MEDKKTLSLEELESVAGGVSAKDATCEVYCLGRCGFSRLYSDEAEAIQFMRDRHRICPTCQNELIMVDVC